MATPARLAAYRARANAARGVTRAVVKRISANFACVAPKQYAVAIDAHRGTCKSTSDLESHFVMLAFAATGPTEACAVRAAPAGGHEANVLLRAF